MTLGCISCIYPVHMTVEWHYSQTNTTLHQRQFSPIIYPFRPHFPLSFFSRHSLHYSVCYAVLTSYNPNKAKRGKTSQPTLTSPKLPTPARTR